MTVSTNPTRADYDGNGTATTFPYAFPVSSPTDIKVWQLVTTNPLDAVQTLLTLDVDYSVTMLTASSGYVTRLSGALPADYHWTIILDLTYEQPTSIKNQGQFYEDVHEAAFDRNVLLTKQVSELIGRTITLPVTLTDVTTEIDNLIDGAAFGLVSKPGGGWQVTMVANSGAQQTADLANTGTATKGAGMVGYAYATAYGAGTVGKALKDLTDADTAMDARVDTLEGNEEPVAQCRLVYVDTSNIRLDRFRGKFLTIGGVRRTIPSGGATLAISGATASTLYYVYAYWTGTDVALERSTTGHSTHTDGTEIKTGDSTRALVGMFYADTGPAYADSLTKRYVASWHNRRDLPMRNQFSTARTTTQTSATEINSEVRVNFVTWAETVQLFTNGNASNSASNTTYSGAGLDGGTPVGQSANTGTNGNPSASSALVTTTEGFHYATFMGWVSAGTGSFGAFPGNVSAIVTI